MFLIISIVVFGLFGLGVSWGCDIVNFFFYIVMCIFDGRILGGEDFYWYIGDFKLFSFIYFFFVSIKRKRDVKEI